MLHPEYSAEVFFESARTLTLRTTGEESFSARRKVPAKHELVLMPSAEGAGFAVELPANSPDFPNLFVHRLSLHDTIPMRVAVTGHILEHLRIFENTVEVGGADLKGGKCWEDNLLLIWAECRIYMVRIVIKEGVSTCIDGKGNCPVPGVGCPNESCIASWEAGVWV